MKPKIIDDSIKIIRKSKPKERFHPPECHMSSAIQTCSLDSCIKAGECTYKPLDGR